MLRRLVRPRYAVLGLVAVLAALACLRLGLWQLHRYEARQDRAEQVRTTADQAPVPLAEAYADGREPAAYSRLTARGRFDADRQVLLRYRPQDGRAGYHVLVPLVTDGDRALLVDRGFLPSDGPGASLPEAPVPPPGVVEVSGWVRASEDGLGFDEDSRTVRRVDLGGLADVLDTPLLPQWLALQEEEPPVATPLEPLDAPNTGLGPHLSYAVQWWLFGVVGIVGLVVLVRNDLRED